MTFQTQADATLNSCSEPPSIALFIPSLDGLGGGGAEQVLVYLAQGFTQLGFRVELVLLRKTGIFLDKIPAKVKIIDLAFNTEKGYLTIRKLLILVRYLRQNRPGALYVISDTDNVTMWAKRLAGVQTQIISVLQFPLSKLLQWTKSPLKRLIIASSYHGVDRIVACSQGVARDLALSTKVNLQNIQVIYNPVDMPAIHRQAREETHHPWFAENQPPVIVGVGRLVEQKDFATLIQAFALVRQHQPVKLIIIGEGNQRLKLENLIAQLGLQADVDLVGFQMNPYAYMAQAQMFVLSSKWEGFGIVVAEALALGTTVVSTDCDYGPAEILASGKYGKLVPVANPAAMAEAMIAGLRSERTTVDSSWLEQFSLEAIIQQYLQIADIIMA